MKPPHLWFCGWSWRGWPIQFGGDEYGQHTVALGLPFVGAVVIAYRRCPQAGKCADMAQFACVTPGCPYTAITTDAECLICDPLEED